MQNQKAINGPQVGQILFTLGLALISAILAFSLVPIPQAHASYPADTIGTGELQLTCRSGRYALPAVHTEVRLDVTGPLVKAVVRQEFTNPTDEVVSARYVFPLPENAAVSAMELLVGERRIISVVKEKAAARKVFEKARKEGRKAALVSSDQGNLFITQVANIEPGQKVSVQLEYLDQADYEDGWFSLVYPLTFTPRFFPPVGGEGAAPDSVTLPASFDAPFVKPTDTAFPQASLEVRLASGLELADLDSPSHSLDMTKEDGTWWLSLNPRTVPADRDFILRWRPVSDPLARPILFSEEGPDGLYGLLMVVPGSSELDPDLEIPRPPTDTVFLLDVSGSMDGPSIIQARNALTTAIGQLRPGDRFNMLTFNDRTHSWRDHLVPVDLESRQAARNWVRWRKANGGTMLHPALLQARLSCGSETVPGRVRQIILLTDAAVGNEAQLLGETVAGLGEMRLHVVGIGSSPNRYLVRRLAGQGGGQAFFVSDNQEDSQRLAAFLTRIGRPQWSNPRFQWQGNPAVEGYPARLPAPVCGQLILWSGCFPMEAKVQGFLRADGGSGPLEIPLQAVQAPAGSGVVTRWAQLKVDDLLAEYDSNRRPEGIRQDVINTALNHGLVTRFTSRVAVETVRTVDQVGPTRNVPSGLPAGSQLLGPLPAAGTMDDFWRLVGLVLTLTGLTVLLIQRRRCAQ